MAEAELNKQGKALGRSKVAVLGLAMKDFSNDDRISPPHHLVQLLQETGATVVAYDPAVPSTYEYKAASLQEAVEEADALIYVTVQEEFLEIDWNKTIAQMKHNPVILDGKNRVPRSVEEKAVLVRI